MFAATSSLRGSPEYHTKLLASWLVRQGPLCVFALNAHHGIASAMVLV